MLSGCLSCTQCLMQLVQFRQVIFSSFSFSFRLHPTTLLEGFEPATLQLVLNWLTTKPKLKLKMFQKSTKISDPEGQKVKNHSFKKRFFFPYKKKNNLSALLNEFQVKQLTPSANKRFPRYLSLIPSKNIFIYLSSTQRERVRERKKERKRKSPRCRSNEREKTCSKLTFANKQIQTYLSRQEVGTHITYTYYTIPIVAVASLPV